MVSTIFFWDTLYITVYYLVPYKQHNWGIHDDNFMSCLHDNLSNYNNDRKYIKQHKKYTCNKKKHIVETNICKAIIILAARMFC